MLRRLCSIYRISILAKAFCCYYLIHQLFVMLLLPDSPTICYVIIIWFTNYLLCYYYLIHQLFMLLLSDSPTIWLIMLHSFQYPKIRWGTRWMQIYINQCVHEIPQWKACKIRHYLFIIPGAMASIKYTEGSAPPFLPSLPQQPCNNNLFQERPGSKPLSSRKVV